MAWYGHSVISPSMLCTYFSQTLESSCSPETNLPKDCGTLCSCGSVCSSTKVKDLCESARHGCGNKEEESMNLEVSTSLGKKFHYQHRLCLNTEEMFGERIKAASLADESIRYPFFHFFSLFQFFFSVCMCFLILYNY